jgi:hypothetical protein
MNFRTIKHEREIKIPHIKVQFEREDGFIRRIVLITDRGELYTIQRERYGDDLRVMHREADTAPDPSSES